MFTQTWKPATFLGMAMVARGEIGLLIIQIGLNDTPFLTEEAFTTATWAIVLNTIIGPVAVGLLLKNQGRTIYNHFRWGVQESEDTSPWRIDATEDRRGSRWTSRLHSGAVSIAASDRFRGRRRGVLSSRPPTHQQNSGDQDRIETALPTSPGQGMSTTRRSSDNTRPPSPSQIAKTKALSGTMDGATTLRRTNISEEPRRSAA